MADNNNKSNNHPIGNNREVSISELRATLASLEDIQLPAEIAKSTFSSSPTSAATTTWKVDTALLELYQQAQERYIKYSLGKTFYDNLMNGTRDDVDGGVDANAVTELQEQLDQLRTTVRQSFENVQQQRLQLLRDYEHFSDRRQQIKEIIEELEKDKTDDEGNDTMEDEDTDVSLDDDEDLAAALAREEERILNLTKHKEELHNQLLSIQEETARINAETAQCQLEFHDLHRQQRRGGDADVSTAAAVDQNGNNTDPSLVTPPLDGTLTLADIEAENQELQRQLQETKNIISWNQEMCAACEHFGGVKIVSVEQGNDSNNNQDGCDDIILTLELLQDSRYTLRLTLQPHPQDQLQLLVVRGIFVPKSAPEACVGQPTSPATTSTTTLMETIPLPELDELIQYARSLNLASVTDNLRFIIREVLMQVCVAEARAAELATMFSEFPQVNLSKSVVVDDGAMVDNQPNPLSMTSTDGISWRHQVVSCLAHGNVVATLRLSPDCPLVNGSVYLDQLWDRANPNEQEQGDLVRIKETISRQSFQSPTALLQAIRDELSNCVLSSPPIG